MSITDTRQPMPPAGSLPLSQILAKVEETHAVRAILEVEWEDEGFWEIELVDTSERGKTVFIDAMTGKDRPDDDRDDADDDPDEDEIDDPEDD